MDTPNTLVFDTPKAAPINDPAMDVNQHYEQEPERPQQVSDDQPIQLAQYSAPVIGPTAETHNIVQAPDGARVAFPKSMSAPEMHQELQKWYAPHIQRTVDAWNSVKTFISNAAEAVGAPASMPELQAKEDEFVRDPVGVTTDAVGGLLRGMSSAVMSLGPGNEENKEMVAKAQEAWAKGDTLAAAMHMIPMVGDGLAKSVKQAQARQFAASLGTATGVALSFTTGDLFKGGDVESTAAHSEVAPETYAGTERRAGARALTTPAENELAMKNRRLQDIHNPFDDTEGASATMNRDINKQIPSPVAINASGESAASQEAINRVQSEKAQGIKTYRVDTRSGNAIPVLGVDAPDAHANPYEHIVQIQDGAVKQIQDSGAGARPLDEVKLLTQVAPKQTVGSTEAAARDTANYTQAKSELGTDASFADIAQRAQKLKDTHVSRGADAFNAENGRPPVEHKEVAAPEHAKAIADEYDKLQHNPNDPEVQKSYSAMKRDIDDQWDFATQKMGIKMEPWTEEGQPYKNSKEMTADVKNNHHLYFFRGGEMPADHPLAEEYGQGLTYNDKLRAVHDLFGHAANENQFGPAGEERAWQEHRQMFSPEAVPAVTTETRGQNSWVNFGKHLRNAEGNIPAKGELGAIPPIERPFAEQKAGLLPEWATKPEGVPADAGAATKTLAHIQSGKDYAVLTAENPKNARISDTENAARNAELEKELRAKGYEPVHVEGNNQDVEGQKEHSLFVPNITPEDAAQFGRKYGQQAVLTTEGLHDLEKNTLMPSDNKNILTDDEARRQPYYSTVGGKDFSVPLGDEAQKNPSQSVGAAAGRPEPTAGIPESTAKNMLGKEVAGVTKTPAATVKFLDTMSKIPEVQEYTDIALAGEGARHWYQRSSSAFDAMTKSAPEYFQEAGDKDKFLGMLGGSSPRQSVAMNLRETLSAWKNWVDAGRPALDLGKWQAYEKAGRPEGEQWKTEKMLGDSFTPAGTKVPNIIKAMNGQDLWPDLTKNKNFKVPSFERNLKGWLNHVTNDGWMALFAGLDPKKISDPALYHPMSVATRAAADALGWEPAEAQAAIWSFTQSLTEKGEEKPDVVRQYSEDFVDLMAHDAQTRDILQDLGVQLDKLDEHLRAIGEKPKITGRTTGTTSRSIGKLKGRIEAARGKGYIPPPKSAQGELEFHEEHPVRAPKGPKDSATDFNPDDMSSNFKQRLNDKMTAALA